MMQRILIAEDVPRIAMFLERGLRSHGYDVVHVCMACEVNEALMSSSIDLLLLDLGLPDGDGLEVLSELRGQGIQTPVIILTARGDLEDKLTGLDGGANDYITKPFRFVELLARIRVQLRSKLDACVPKRGDLIRDEFSGISLNRQTFQAGLDADACLIDLSPREFRLLHLLMAHPGGVVAREEILERVWGYNHDQRSNIVDVYVGYLRKKLGSHRILTVRGFGYRLASRAVISPSPSMHSA
jgi:two-component system, OmpR family, response regulator QseB